MMGVGVWRWVAGAAVRYGLRSALACTLAWGSAGIASADIYQWRDAYGTLHFTNVPTNSRYRVVMRENRAIRSRGSVRVGPMSARGDSRMFDPIISSMSRLYRVDQSLVKAVIRAESSFRPNAVSPKGARGLMQLMPATARRHGVRNIHSPAENIRGGVEHLRMLLDRYDQNVVLALAAYNAGAGPVDRHRGIPPFRETQDYVHKVLQFRQQYLQQRLASVR
jgi:soluble lytic murein transglycosylase-like protein